ncbi:GNAT family N-acetyltransferase [Cytobacillus sp. Sa5YUA1]|uniref:GNAT family N-acetyltransferase n=1 Tax=Cytobacillus stercorigallinarum TaxID=2762240 RepID=A0ABR8QQD8_9BACI|nr:GNAT family N-acetyltransferase [Cytobacillus stercorigallinarum]MBD7937735.1 GNAT family N-acetyltransferase [Cytobacillus stercorigallinarum]
METTTFNKVKEDDAEILSSWTYPPPYDFYNHAQTEDRKQEWLTGNYFCIYKQAEMIGFFCYGESARVPVNNCLLYIDEYIDIGLGMRPDLTGKGGGKSFLTSILMEIERLFPNTPIRLTVASFNKRAIHLYEKLGFIIQHQFQRKSTTFYIMVRKK